MGRDEFRVFLFMREGTTLLLADRGTENPVIWPGDGGFLLAGKGTTRADVEELIFHLRTQSSQRTRDGQFIVVRNSNVCGLEDTVSGEVEWLLA